MAVITTHQPCRNLLQLPPEVLHIVCSFLGDGHARIFRQVCKSIGAIADCYSFRRLVFSLHIDDLEMLRHFANHPTFSKNVESLHYHGDVIDPRLKSYQKWLSCKHFWEQRRSKYIYPPKNHSSIEPCRELEAKYQRYVSMLRQQSHLLTGNTDLATLQYIIPKFTSLSIIVVSVAGCFSRGARSPFDAACISAGDHLLPSGMRHISSILTPLRLEGLHPTLRHLKLGNFHWSVLELFNEQMECFCRNLKSFDLCISTEDGLPGDDEYGVELGYASACRQIVQKGGLKRLLRRMPHLEQLFIEFSDWESDEEGNYVFPAGLCDIIPTDMHWEHLHDLSLATIEASRQEIIDFTERHSTTLSTIDLANLHLIESSWHIFSSQLRALLSGKESFGGIGFRGGGLGAGEGDDAGLESAREHFSFGNGITDLATCLGSRLADYIIGDIDANPLDDYRYTP